MKPDSGDMSLNLLSNFPGQLKFRETAVISIGRDVKALRETNLILAPLPFRTENGTGTNRSRPNICVPIYVLNETAS
jgi:hypothetical protein